jgi:hypothetical protein
VIADGAGHAIAFRIAPGQAHELPHALPLLDQLPDVPKWVVADRGYSSGGFRQHIEEAGAKSAIPSKRNEAPVRCPDWIYAARSSILTEAVLAAEAGQWVSYSRHKPRYSGQSRYRGPAYSFTIVPPTVDALERAGLLEHDRAPPGRRGWQSRFTATPHLRKLWHGARATFRRPEVLYLKNEDKSLIDYKETDRTRQMRRDLQGINEFLRTIEFDLNAPDAVRTGYHVELDGAFYLPLIEPEVYRVFNRSSWHMGGRLYGWWQALPKIRRAAALINGEPVREPGLRLHACGHSVRPPRPLPRFRSL